MKDAAPHRGRRGSGKFRKIAVEKYATATDPVNPLPIEALHGWQLRFLAHLNDERAVERYGLGLDLPPGHIIDELRLSYWRWQRRGFSLPAHRNVISIHGDRV